MGWQDTGGCGWQVRLHPPFCWTLMKNREKNPVKTRMDALKRAAFMLALGLALAACSDLATGSPLSNARKSPEALARAALSAVAVEDHDALNELLITRDEYENLLWPLMPDRHYTDFKFVWGMSAPRSRKGRREVVNDYRGLPLELVSVELGEETEEYETFVLWKDVRMTVRRTDTGEEGVFPLMDVLVEMDGGWKFMNFREDV